MSQKNFGCRRSSTTFINKCYFLATEDWPIFCSNRFGCRRSSTVLYLQQVLFGNRRSVKSRLQTIFFNKQFLGRSSASLYNGKLGIAIWQLDKPHSATAITAVKWHWGQWPSSSRAMVDISFENHLYQLLFTKTRLWSIMWVFHLVFNICSAASGAAGTADCSTATSSAATRLDAPGWCKASGKFL